MAIVQKGVVEEGGAGGNPQSATITATTAGNLLVVWAFSGGDTALSPPTAPSGSWVSGTDLDGEPGSSKHGRFFWLPNIAAGITTITWPWVAGDHGFVYWELSGRDTVTPLDAQTAGTNGVSTTPTDSALVASVPGGDMLVGCFLATSQAFTVGAGFTDLVTGATLLVSAGEAKLNTSGSNTGTFTLDGSNSWGIISIVFKPASGAGIGQWLGNTDHPGLSPGVTSAMFQMNWWPYRPPAISAFDDSLMAAMNWPWPQTSFSLPQVVASGMTPSDNIPT